MLAHALVEPAGDSARRWALFAHGVLGTRSNLRSIARRFVSACPDWGAVLVDLPFHGESRGVPGPPTLDTAASELMALCEVVRGPVEGIFGHSLGGKIALEHVRQRGGDLAHAWIVDASPSARPSPREDPGSQATLAVVDALERVSRSQPFPTRADFLERIGAEGIDPGVGQWLAMNVKPAGGSGFEVALDLAAVRALLEDHFSRDLWSVIESPPGRARIHLVIGGRSASLDASDRERAARAAASSNGRVSVHVLEDASHWVHSDDPEGLLAVLALTAATV